MDWFMIGSTMLAPIVAGLTELVKKVGVPSKWAWLVNLVITTLFFVLWQAAGQGWVDPTVVESALTILIGFLAAAGFYETVRFAAGR